MPPTALGLIVPLGQTCDLDTLAGLVADRVLESLWVRDLPAVASTDPDQGQGSDPWWCLGRLCGAGLLPDRVGTASIILGTRHPWLVARAAAGAQVDTGGRLVLGVGSGGKPEMNRALGVAGRSYHEFATEWARLRSALRAVDDGPVALNPPAGYRPPPVQLATSDTERWQAIDGDAGGWQTFLTDDHDRFVADHDRICAIRGAATPVDLRLDVHLEHSAQAGVRPQFMHAPRGRVRCTPDQLPALVSPWLGDPVRRLLLRLTGPAPEAALRHLRERIPTGEPAET